MLLPFFFFPLLFFRKGSKSTRGLFYLNIERSDSRNGSAVNSSVRGLVAVRIEVLWFGQAL